MITFDHLTKRYGDELALDDASFAVDAGTIVGFLGPNGAGKSTALRILLGMAPATSGGATVGGRRYLDWPSPARVVGSLLDADCFHGGRSGRASLRVACRVLGLAA